MEINNKAECLESLKTLEKSCEEGISGEWDCSTDEGKKGFDAMIEEIQAVRKFIKKNLK